MFYTSLLVFAYSWDALYLFLHGIRIPVGGGTHFVYVFDKYLYLSGAFCFRFYMVFASLYTFYMVFAWLGALCMPFLNGICIPVGHSV